MVGSRTSCKLQYEEMVRSNCAIPSLRSLSFQRIDLHMERDIITKKEEEETLTNVF